MTTIREVLDRWYAFRQQKNYTYEDSSAIIRQLVDAHKRIPATADVKHRLLPVMNRFRVTEARESSAHEFTEDYAQLEEYAHMLQLLDKEGIFQRYQRSEIIEPFEQDVRRIQKFIAVCERMRSPGQALSSDRVDRAFLETFGSLEGYLTYDDRIRRNTVLAAGITPIVRCDIELYVTYGTILQRARDDFHRAVFRDLPASAAGK